MVGSTIKVLQNNLQCALSNPVSCTTTEGNKYKLTANMPSFIDIPKYPKYLYVSHMVRTIMVSLHLLNQDLYYLLAE